MKKIFFVLGLFLVPILALVTACGSKSSPSSPAAATATATPTPNVSTLATLSYTSSPVITGIVVDSSGNVYAADSYNNLIWKVTSAGVTSVFASGFGVNGLAMDSSGNLYTSQGSASNIIYKITSAGVKTSGTVAGISFHSVQGLAINSAGTTLYVADSVNSYVAMVNVSTWAAANVVSVNTAKDVAIDSAGNLYVTDYNDAEIYEIAAGTSTATALAGDGAGYAIGANASAKFNDPEGIAVDTTGHVYVASIGSYVIQEIYSGNTSLFAGTQNTQGTTNSTPTSSEFENPYAIAVDASGNVYVSDNYNVIRKIEP